MIQLSLSDGIEFEWDDEIDLRNWINQEHSFFAEVFSRLSNNEIQKYPSWKALCEAHKKVNESPRTTDSIIKELMKAYEELPNPKMPIRILAHEIQKQIGTKARIGFVKYMLTPQYATLDEEGKGELIGYIVNNGGRLNLDSEAARSLFEQAVESRNSMSINYNQEIETCKQWVSEQKEELASLKREYKEIKKYEEPASFWWWRSRLSYLFSIIYLTIAVLVGLIAGNKLITKVESRFESIEPEAVTSYFQLVPTLLPLLFITFGLFWVLRILVKLGFTQWHVATDASERLTMISTWLAMHAGGEEPDAGDRQIMLQQIFRHNPTGVVKEDTAPDNILLKKATD